MKKNNSLLGAHVSFTQKGQLLQALKDLFDIKASSGAFYISNSRGYSKTFEINLENVKEAHKLAQDNNFSLENIIVHSPLIGNISNTEKQKNIFQLTLKSYIEDIKRMDQLGLKYYNFHPGSSKDKELGIQRCADGINEIIQKTIDSKTILCLETMMHKGNYIGSNFEELSLIIKKVKNQERIGVIMDTCHIWDAGYDLNDFEKVLEEFDSKIGLSFLKGLHINDSKNPLGSAKDRHESIGDGFIGLENLKKIINHEKIKNLPKALETPYGKDDFLKWKNEIEILLN